MARGVCVTIATCVSACGFHGAQPPSGDDATSMPDSGNGDADADLDGVFDAADNCPARSNPDQHDEDGDLAGDACDPCPQVANATLDTDGDGLADACDPRPATGGDQLVLFETFAGSGNLPPGWQHKGGGAPSDWKRGDDALTIDADNNTRVAIVPAGAQRHAIDAGIDMVSLDAGTGFQFVTVLADTRADIQQFIGCGMRFDAFAGGPGREVFAFSQPTYSTLALDQTEPPTGSGAYRLTFVLDGAEECTIPGATLEHRQVRNVIPFGNTFVGLRINNATVAFRYVAVYRF
jgi:hypothetical protein